MGSDIKLEFFMSLTNSNYIPYILIWFTIITRAPQSCINLNIIISIALGNKTKNRGITEIGESLPGDMHELCILPVFINPMELQNQRATGDNACRIKPNKTNQCITKTKQDAKMDKLLLLE